MIAELPMYINFIFGITTLLTVFLFYKAAHHSKLVLGIIVAWLILQTGLGFSSFYQATDNMPPRFVLLILPPLLLITWVFLSAKGKAFITQLDLNLLTYLHIVRVPVELVLFALFLHHQVPQLMTFEGRNLDILAGSTAPIMAYFLNSKQAMSKNILLLWNILSLGLLLNIVVNAVLSAPTPFQQFGFSQPNLAILYFPFIWLPCCIVPIVLFSHLAAIKKLLSEQTMAAPKT